MIDKLSRNPRVFVAGLILFLLGYWLLSASQNAQPRDTTQRLLEDAQPVSSFEAVIVGDTSWLKGKLIFVEQRAQPHYRIAQLDFATKSISTVLEISSGALVFQVSKSAESQQLLITYSAPDSTGNNTYDRNGVYSVSLKDGSLKRLFGEDRPNLYYAYPRQVGDSIYYAIYEKENESKHIEKYDLRTHAITRIADNATQPITSSDGKFVAWLHIDPDTQARSLWVQATENGKPAQLVGDAQFADIDNPMFSEDGKWLYFSVLEGQPPPTRRSASNIWSGVYSASAHGNHNLPSRWYRIAIEGGAATSFTTKAMVTRAGDFNNQIPGFISDTGFFVVRDSLPEEIIRSRALGSFVWLP